MKDRLFKYYSDKVAEIKKQKFNRFQVNDLYKDYVRNCAGDVTLGKMSLSEFDKVCTDLKLAFNVAYSNYEKDRRDNSILRKISIKIGNIFGLEPR